MVQKSRNVYTNNKGAYSKVFDKDTHIEQFDNEWYEERREGARISPRIKDILVKFDIDLNKALVLDRVEIEGVVVGYQLVTTLDVEDISYTKFIECETEEE